MTHMRDVFLPDDWESHLARELKKAPMLDGDRQKIAKICGQLIWDVTHHFYEALQRLDCSENKREACEVLTLTALGYFFTEQADDLEEALEDKLQSSGKSRWN